LRLRRAFAHLVAILLLAPCDGVFAGQPTASDTVANSAGPSNAEEPPPGGCLPIGVTASGEVVFPFMCKGFLERNRGSAAAAPIDQQKPASEKPLPSNLSSGPESAVGAIQPEKSEPDISQPEPIQVDTVSSIDPSGASSKGANKKKAPLISSRDCKRYRSFDAASETYRDNAGHRRPCHS
jgi:BA14K-like protein